MTTTTSSTYAHQVAKTIQAQITQGVMWSLGAHKLGYAAEGNPGLVFMARILPFNEAGKRLQSPRIMRVRVLLNGADLYDITVDYLSRGKIVTHYEARDIYADMLARTMLALDSSDDRA